MHMPTNYSNFFTRPRVKVLFFSTPPMNLLRTNGQTQSKAHMGASQWGVKKNEIFKKNIKF